MDAVGSRAIWGRDPMTPFPDPEVEDGIGKGMTGHKSVLEMTPTYNMSTGETRDNTKDRARGATGEDEHDGTKARSREQNEDNGSTSGMTGERQRKDNDDEGMRAEVSSRHQQMQ